MSQNHETNIPKWVARWVHPKSASWKVWWMFGVFLAAIVVFATTDFAVWVAHRVYEGHHNLGIDSFEDLLLFQTALWTPQLVFVIPAVLPLMAEWVGIVIARRWLRSEWRDATGERFPKNSMDIFATLERLARSVASNPSYLLPRFYRARDAAAALGYQCQGVRVRDYART